MQAKNYKIPEQREANRPLGRHVLHDPRSRKFDAAQAHTIKSVVHASRGLPLDQTRGSCTADALCGALDSDPDFKGTIRAQADAEFLYDQEIVLEGYDPVTDDPGGTGLMVCKAAKELGWIRRYEHAFGTDHALKALTLRPIMAGVNWYSSFDTPDSVTGVVTLTANAYIRGGHEFVVDELDVISELVGCWNSWGPNYGIGGRFYMTFNLFDKLLHEDGDVTVPLV